MEFQTQAQQDCYEKLNQWMGKLFSDIPWERLDVPGFGLFMGSAWVEIRILPWNGDDDTVINVRSKVVTGTQQTPELQNFLLRENAERCFGAFSIDSNGDVLFEHTIVGSTCDPKELETSAIAVLEAADEYDDRIVGLWGGKRALDLPPE